MDVATRRRRRDNERPAAFDVGTAMMPRRVFKIAGGAALALVLAVAPVQAQNGAVPAPAGRPAAKPAVKPAVKPGAATGSANDTAPSPLGKAVYDPAYGAFQRGYFLTAFQLAEQRIEQDKDPKSMTLLGELYANGLGVPQDDHKAADWYKLAAARGDSNAMFALAIFALGGRGGPRDRQASANWLAAAAKLGHPQAAYDLALLYIEGQLFPQDFTRAAELLRVAADAGSPDAEYALGTFYKEGRGVPKDMKEAVKLWARAALADNTDAEVEYAIALYNGDGIERNEGTAALIFHKAALHNSAIAQDRLALILSRGQGAPVSPINATKWHLISQANGETDLELDGYVAKLDPETRAAGQKAAKIWLDAQKTAAQSIKQVQGR
jgi:TPR repeat protein